MHTDHTRLAGVHQKVAGRVQLVLHGTNEFTPEILNKCIQRGVTRVNVNKMVLSNYLAHIEEKTGKVPLTSVIEDGTRLIQMQCEGWMDAIGCSGKA